MCAEYVGLGLCALQTLRVYGLLLFVSQRECGPGCQCAGLTDIDIYPLSGRAADATREDWGAVYVLLLTGSDCFPPFSVVKTLFSAPVCVTKRRNSRNRCNISAPVSFVSAELWVNTNMRPLPASL